MSIKSLQGQSFQTHLQEALTAYSSSAKGISEILAQMDTYKGIWTRNITDLSISSPSQKEKDEMVAKGFAAYHTFKKTLEVVIALFDTLTATHQFCDRTPISKDTYETITNLTGSSADLEKKEQALMRVNRYIGFLADKTNKLFKVNIETRLPQVSAPLNQLIQTIHPGLGGWFSTALQNGYDKWLKNPSNEQRNWKMDTSLPIASSEESREDDETVKGLDEALKTLDLSFVDPHTLVHYGVQPSGPSHVEVAKKEENSSSSKASLAPPSPSRPNLSASLSSLKPEYIPSGSSSGSDLKGNASASSAKFNEKSAEKK